MERLSDEEIDKVILDNQMTVCKITKRSTAWEIRPGILEPEIKQGVLKFSNAIQDALIEKNKVNHINCGACSGDGAICTDKCRLDEESPSIQSENQKPDLTELVEMLKFFESLISESSGVAGFHLNGAVASWGEFEEVTLLQEFIAKHGG